MADWQLREVDRTTADAVALMTLYITATDEDEASARELLEELVAAPDGINATVGGLESLCGMLLVLLEIQTGAQPHEVLQRVGAIAATPLPS